jgi:uncharacterized protein YecE (DUF72 family)
MSLLVGTSGYSYKEWKGNFYPDDLPDREMLKYYGSRLPTVEINNTFYRLPKESVLTSWADQVPAHFRFSIKASQRITHIKRLKDAGDETEYLLRTVRILGVRLGTILFQLPPNLKKDLARLEQFLKHIPGDVRAAFEFRHASWFEDDVFNLLRSNRCALCIADADDDLQIPFVGTADWGYLRLRREVYTGAALKGWMKRIQEQAWADTFVFFKHEDEGTGPRLAAQFIALGDDTPVSARTDPKPAAKSRTRSTGVPRRT